MRRILGITFLLFVVLSATAQNYERKDFTFKTIKVKNAEGEVSHVKVGAYVGKKLIKEYLIYHI